MAILLKHFLVPGPSRCPVTKESSVSKKEASTIWALDLSERREKRMEERLHKRVGGEEEDRDRSPNQ
jgi:hypothetical protein